MPRCERLDIGDVIRVEGTERAQLIGTLTCLIDGTEWSVVVRRDRLESSAALSLGSASQRLNKTVPSDIAADMKEAERAHFSQCDRASVALCRHALRLGLLERGITDGPLGSMLGRASTLGLLTDSTHELSLSLKGYAETGPYRWEQPPHPEMEMMIYSTVLMLNELFPPA